MVASICFHFSHLLVAIVLASFSLVAWKLNPINRNAIKPFILVGALGLAFAAFFSFSLVVYKKISLTPNSPPFLLARVLADGPGKAYLKATCDQKAYALCPYLDQIPATENEFLWRYLPKITAIHPEIWQKSRNEQFSIVLGSARMFPLWMIKNMLRNTAEQLITIKSSTLNDNDDLFAKYPFVAEPYAKSLLGQKLLTDEALAYMNMLHACVVILSFIPLGYFLIKSSRQGELRPILLTSTVVVGLITNAFATGALGGVFGRYEGRGIWLIPFCAVVSVLVFVKKPDAKVAGLAIHDRLF